MTKRHITAMFCVIGAGLLAGGAAWYRLSRVTPESDPLAYWMDEGSRVYSKMNSVPIRDVEAVRLALVSATIEDAEGLVRSNPPSLESLRETALDFLDIRLNASAPGDYVSAMESRGYRFKSPADFEKRYGPLQAQADRIGMRADDVPALFAAMWAYEPSRRGTPDAVCSGPKAMTITLGHSNKNHFLTQDLAGLLGFDLWHGGAGATCRFWMRPPVSREELIERHGQVVAAQVGVIACVPGSARRPLILNLFLEPDSSRWWIDGVSVTNFVGTSDSWTCSEY